MDEEDLGEENERSYCADPVGEELSRREFLNKLIVGGIALGAASLPLSQYLFGNNARAGEIDKDNCRTLTERLYLALEPKGDIKAKHRIHYDLKRGHLKEADVDVRIENIRKGALRFLVYPEESLWCQGLVFDKIDFFLLTTERSRFEYQDYAVFQNRQQQVSMYCATDHELEETDTVIDKIAGLSLEVLKKLGINKTDLLYMLESLDPSVFPDAFRDSRLRQKAIENGNLIAKDHIYIKRISYNGMKYLSMDSIRDTKLYELVVNEGEKAIAGVMVAAKLYSFKDIKLAPEGVPIGEYGFHSNTETTTFSMKLEKR